MTFEEAKILFNSMHEESLQFRYQELLDQNDIIHDVIIENKEKFDLKPYTHVKEYIHLSEVKGLSLGQLHENYWNGLVEKYNQSFSEAQSLIKFYAQTLERDLYPKYFSTAEVLLNYYLNNSYSQVLYEENPAIANKTLSWVYSLSTTLLQEDIESLVINEDFFGEKTKMGLRFYLEWLIKKGLKIYDFKLKTETLLSFHHYSIHMLDELDKDKPIRKVPTWEQLTGEERNRLPINNLDRGRPSAIKSSEDFENFKKAAKSIEIDPDGPVKNKTAYWEELSEILKRDYDILIKPDTIRQNYYEYLPQEVKNALN